MALKFCKNFAAVCTYDTIPIGEVDKNKVTAICTLYFILLDFSFVSFNFFQSEFYHWSRWQQNSSRILT
jgi:hypothetical protein